MRKLILMHSNQKALLGASLVASALIGAGSARAAQPAPSHIVAPTGSDDAVQAYWTPERIANAKSADMIVQGPLRRGHVRPQATAARQIVPGALPKLPYDESLAVKLYDDSLIPHREPTLQPIVGSGGLPFTTNRLYPAGDKVLHAVYPYATVGHLYFTEPSGDFQCSASVIRANTIATAGHCVNDGNGNYYTNWLFIPAQNGSLAPYGKWTWANAITTSAWYSGGGGVPNEQDDAVIVLNQRKVKGTYYTVGDYVGYLGYEFNAPLPTTVTQLGYPCNLDACGDPIATYAQDTAGPTNNFQWGSASFGGASGGPEIQDFGQAPSGVPSETLGGNIAVSSFSYYYTTAGVDVDGGSIYYSPGQNGEYTFGDDLNYACSNNGC